MIVLGVDAALNKSGLAICRDDVITWTKVCRSPAKLPPPGKLRILHDEAEVALTLALRDEPIAAGAFVLVERPGAWARGSPRSSQRTVEALAQSRAAVHLAAVNKGRRSFEIDVNEARRLILGTEQAGIKGRVRHLLELRGVDPKLVKDPDCADAAVIALAGWSLWKAGEYVGL